MALRTYRARGLVCFELLARYSKPLRRPKFTPEFKLNLVKRYLLGGEPTFKLAIATRFLLF